MNFQLFIEKYGHLVIFSIFILITSPPQNEEVSQQWLFAVCAVKVELIDFLRWKHSIEIRLKEGLFLLQLFVYLVCPWRGLPYVHGANVVATGQLRVSSFLLSCRSWGWTQVIRFGCKQALFPTELVCWYIHIYTALLRYTSHAIQVSYLEYAVLDLSILHH